MGRRTRRARKKSPRVGDGPDGLPRPKKEYPKCVFCGEKANSREHAIPKWMAKQLGVKVFIHEHAHLTHNVPSRKQPISFASYRGRVFCHDCNKHFKHLEDRVIPFIVPMARGRTLVLQRSSQDLLALWAVKTAIAIGALTVPDFSAVVPEEHRRTVRNDARLVDEIWVGYFPWSGGVTLSAGAGECVAKDSLEPGFEAWGILFTFEKMAFRVLGFTDDLKRRGAVLQKDVGSMRQFAPPRYPVITWPPGPPITGESMRPLLDFTPIRIRK